MMGASARQKEWGGSPAGRENCAPHPKWGSGKKKKRDTGRPVSPERPMPGRV